MPDEPSPLRILRLDEVDSTNSEAFRQAAAGEMGPLWIVARRQRTGRGRSGRAWASPEGNLYASLLISLASGPREAAGLSLLAGVAVRDALSPFVPDLRLKWPNDILLDGAKLCGILIETAPRGRGGLDAVIGVGVNIASHPDGLGRRATSLAAHGIVLDPERVVEAIAGSFHHWIALWREGAGFARVREAWLEGSIPAGTPLGVNGAGRRLTGAFAGLESDGTLLLRQDDGRLARVTFGDVSIGCATES